MSFGCPDIKVNNQTNQLKDIMRTNNNDFTHENTQNALLDFFSKAGSLFNKRSSHYGNEVQALDLFKNAWVVDQYKSMQLAFWLRNARGGSGNRSGFRDIIKWLAKEDPNWIEANIKLIPEYGRWDDLIQLMDTTLERFAFSFWVGAIRNGNCLAAKWAPREDKNKIVFNKLRTIAGLTAKQFRKLLVENTKVVETQMCSKDWNNIEYNHVPSVAASRYSGAFAKHDSDRYGQWVKDLKNGVDKNGKEVKVNASVLFPHDVVRGLIYGKVSEDLSNAQFDALPDYLSDKTQRIMSICDFSGSMRTTICGEIRAVDVSLGLGLYCSDRLGKDNPFYRMFIPFSDHSSLVSWKDNTFSSAIVKVNDGWCGSTNIEAALNQILASAKMFKATNDQIPTTLLIISDMQFDQGAVDNKTAVESAMDNWEKAGYTRPKIVYWNTSGYAGSPATAANNNTALVSGFSPSILKAVLACEDFSPLAIMNKTLEAYNITRP